MYAARRVSLKIIFKFAWKSLLFFLIYSTALCFLYNAAKFKFFAVPFLPIGVIGTAVAFYVGFKNNSSYERLWEARRIWGAIVNASRTWAIFVRSYIASPVNSLSYDNSALKEYHRELIYRHLAYINVLKSQLRRQTVWQECVGIGRVIVENIEVFRHSEVETELRLFLPENEVQYFNKCQNPATQILDKQAQRLKELKDQGLIDEFKHVEMGRSLAEFYNQQGACERIKSFPFPRQYAFFSTVFTWLFIILLPLGLISELAKQGTDYIWLTIPFHMVISWVFNTMEVVGDTSENPFENSINDVPMSAICRNIEIDLKEMLGETELPAKLKAINNIIM